MSADLREIVARDLRPVKPLLPPSRRAFLLLPIAAAIVIGIPVLHAFRPDFEALGFARAWGLSILESLAGLGIVALGLRESVPGRAMKAGALTLAVVAGLALPPLVYRATSSAFNVGPTSWSEWRYGMECFRVSVFATAPLLLLTAFLVKRALPMRSVTTGLLWGIGCGLVGDAGLRLYCDFTTLPHLVLEHFAAILFAAIAGAVITPATSHVDQNRARPAARDRRQG